jgi:hypothetical protein
MVSFTTHVSQAYVTTGLITLQFYFNFDFLETNLLSKKNLLASVISSYFNPGEWDFGTVRIEI